MLSTSDSRPFYNRKILINPTVFWEFIVDLVWLIIPEIPI